jgi:two-component system, NtrC family, sensor histidine kinase HydH
MTAHPPPACYLSRMSSSTLLYELVDYVGFGPEDAALLSAARPLVAPHFPKVVDAFYAAIEASPRARAVFEDEAQIHRQKRVLGTWLESLFGGVYDEAYFESRARIGYAHVRIDLDPSLMIAGMSVVRAKLSHIADAIDDEELWSRDRIRALKRAIDRICDVDLAVMLETYRDDYMAKVRGAERLAALGQIAGTIGHELRNPLAVMETSVHLLRSRIKGDEKAERHLERLAGQISLSTRIIGEIMDLARELPPKRERHSVRGVVEDALASMVEGESVRVSIEPEDELECHVDGVQLRQLLVNLVTNAVQSARSGAKGVELTIRRDGEELHVRVEDDGPGVPEEIRSRIFEPLFTTKLRGVGFGLALCRRIAERHGGYIRVSNRETGGAKFEAMLLCSAENPR